MGVSRSLLDSQLLNNALQNVKLAFVINKLSSRNVCTPTAQSLKDDFKPNESKMIAWQIHSYGGLEELQLSKSARFPHIKNPKDVLIKINSASVNPIDVDMMSGYGSVLFNTARQMEACSSSSIVEFPLILGRDFAGIVVGKGHGVAGNFKIGEEVWGSIPPYQQGSHAQHIVINESLIHKKPINLNMIEAGSLPYAGITAWSALKYSGDLYFTSARGKRVLVLGGSGGVGSIAIQLLKAWGANVVTTCRGDACPLVETLGADVVIDYTLPDAEKVIREEGKYDMILDTAGLGPEAGPNYADCLKDWNLSKYVTLTSPLLKNVDTYGLVGGMVRNAMDLVVPNVRTNLLSGLSSVRWGFFFPTQEALREISILTEERRITPIVEQVFPLPDLPSAYKRVQEGHLRGKVVVSMLE